MTQFVFDASAVITVLQNEPGSQAIAPHCSEGLISTVNLHEVAKALVWQGVDIEIAKAMISSLQLRIIAHNETDAYEAANLVSFTSKFGSGLGDRTCMALAIAKGVPAITTDRAWAQLSIPGLTVFVAR